MGYINLMDMHIHSDNSHDADHSVTLLCEKAVAKNLKAIAITDHCDCINYKSSNQDIICRQSAFEVKKAQMIFKDQLDVICGIELGSPARDSLAVDDVLKNGFDFVLASVHRIKGKKVSFGHYDFSRENNRPECLIPRYLDEILETVQWNGFDSLAHLTYPFRYYPPEQLADFSLDDYKDKIDEILKTLAENGKALEINTACEPFIMGGKEYNFHPDFEIVKRFRELGGEYITIGSDAHKSSRVGDRIDLAYDIAKLAGFQCVTVYKNRKPMPISIY